MKEGEIKNNIQRGKLALRTFGLTNV